MFLLIFGVLINSANQLKLQLKMLLVFLFKSNEEFVYVQCKDNGIEFLMKLGSHKVTNVTDPDFQEEVWMDQEGLKCHTNEGFGVLAFYF